MLGEEIPTTFCYAILLLGLLLIQLGQIPGNKCKKNKQIKSNGYWEDYKISPYPIKRYEVIK